ncbi:WW domain-binding protein 11-like [Panicum virgatum]|uniref:WW domain-binding protein 11-like n=1 Tax=Panicum virgatum TaxID=38727 RepID=UPI0019D64489|nr:WW domain-binding protein 11-like [Panicum virgatum]
MDMDVSEFRERQAANTLFSKYAEFTSSVQTEGFMNKAPSAIPAIRPPITPSQGVGLLRAYREEMRRTRRGPPLPPPDRVPASAPPRTTIAPAIEPRALHHRKPRRAAGRRKAPPQRTPQFPAPPPRPPSCASATGLPRLTAPRATPPARPASQLRVCREPPAGARRAASGEEGAWESADGRGQAAPPG